MERKPIMDIEIEANGTAARLTCGQGELLTGRGGGHA